MSERLKALTAEEMAHWRLVVMRADDRLSVCTPRLRQLLDHIDALQRELAYEAERANREAALKESARRYWSEAQERLAQAETRLIEITGVRTDIFTNISELAEARKDVARLDWILAQRDGNGFHVWIQVAPQAHICYFPEGFGRSHGEAVWSLDRMGKPTAFQTAREAIDAAMGAARGQA